MDNAEVYEKYSDELIRFAGALVGPSGAEDLLADAVIKAFGSRCWTQIENKRAYLYRVVWSEAHKQRRAVQRRLWRETRSAPPESTTPATLDRDIIRALRQLQSRQRAVIYLTYWLDMTPDDVAAYLDVSRRSVERDLTNARQTLEALLT